MIIKLHISVIKCIENEKDMNGQAFIEDLCTARRLGIVVVESTKKDIQKILELNSTSALQKIVLKQINSEITFSKELTDLITYRVTFYNSDYITSDISEKTDVMIDIKNYFTDYSLNGKTIFSLPKIVVEDLSDYDVYTCIYKWYSEKYQILAGQTIRLEMVHGGGDRSADVCKEYYENGYLVYSICDSDKKYPGDNNGETASKLVDYFSSIGQIDNLMVLDVQEIENLIPLCVLQSTARETQLPAITFIGHTITKSIEAIYYMDLKNGFSYRRVFIEEDDYSKYWERYFNDLNCKFYTEQVDKINKCEIGDKSNITVKLSSMLPHAIKKLSNFDNRLNKHCPLEPIWCNIGSKIWAWGCGGKAINV